MIARVMLSRAAAKGLLTAITLVAAVASISTVATAQDGSRWETWDSPSWRRPPSRIQDPYNDRADDNDDEDRDEPLQDRRLRRWQDDNDADEAPYENNFGDRRRRFEQRRFNRHNFEDEDNYGPPDTAREPQDEAEQTKAKTADGGPRPPIAPVAPPVVAMSGSYATGSIIIDTSARKLYHVVRPGAAFAYPIGVGREGFSWTGSEKVSRITDWPDWYPPAEMRKRKPELPERMMGGLNNPLGAKAIYLGNTLYRIHGTNDPRSIGKAESSGCFRMLNAHVLHLASRVQTGTQVTVVTSLGANKVAAKTTPRPVAKSRPALRPRTGDRTDDRYDDPYDDWSGREFR
jgi:lipoprotein-anchoring transpeptidase ErfK/SrfK